MADPAVVGPEGTYQVTRVYDESREWKSRYDKEMRSYRIDVKASDGTTFEKIELAQLRTTDPPAVGQALDGKVNRRTYESQGETHTDLKFEKASRGGGGGGGGGGGRAWKPRPDDAPVVYAARQAQIVRQHSQDMAMRVLELTSRMAGSDQPEATLAALMGLLGVPTESDEGEPYGLVEAFALDAGRSALRAWNGEAEAKRIAGALKDLE